MVIADLLAVELKLELADGSVHRHRFELKTHGRLGAAGAEERIANRRGTLEGLQHPGRDAQFLRRSRLPAPRRRRSVDVGLQVLAE